MFLFLKGISKLIFIGLCTLLFIRFLFKANILSIAPQWKLATIKFYALTDQILAPTHSIVYEISSWLPLEGKRVFPLYYLQKNSGIYEWNCLITIFILIVIAILIDYLLNTFKNYEEAIICVLKKERHLNSNYKTDTTRPQKHRNLKDNANKNQKDDDKIFKLKQENLLLTQKNVSLAKEIITDTLTGLKNRKYLEEKLEMEFMFAKFNKVNLSVMMIDIDNFKKVNDNHGHQVGDQVLQAVAQIVLSYCKGKIFAARYGGEEITLVCPKYNEQSALSLAEDLRKKIDHSLSYSEKFDFSVTISIGLASIAFSESISDYNELLKKADSALYESKNSGKNQTSVYR